VADSEKPKPKPDVNATIQLDQVDADQITFPDSQPAPHRVVPPPLPPEVRAQAAAPVQAPPPPAQPIAAAPPKSSGKTIALIGAFVVLVVLAIVGGLKVGSLAHGGTPAASASASASIASPAATPAPTPSASASASASNGPVHEITIPTIEMR
jgi:hypothetical protein